MQSYILDDSNSDDNFSAANHTLIRPVLREGSLVKTSESYALAIVHPTKVRKPEREQVTILDTLSPSLITETLGTLRVTTDPLVALDIETVGTDPLAEVATIVGIGLANSQAALYFDTSKWGQEQWEILVAFLQNKETQFIVHNAMFEVTWFASIIGNFSANICYDTYAIYRQIANEGYGIQIGGAYALKQAQIDLLGWDSRGDEELSEWLVANGYYKGNIKSDATSEEALERYEAGTLKPDKSKMYLAPAEILGYYCALDAVSTYQLFTEVFIPSINAHDWSDTFWNYHHTFMRNIEALAEQRLLGIKIDLTRLNEHLLTLENNAETTRGEFLNHPELAPHINNYRETKIAEYASKEPNQFKAPPKLGNEPARMTKAGTISRVWERWSEKKQGIEDGSLLERNPAWDEWKDKLDKMEQDDLFNLDSGPMRRWLFYDALGYPVKARTEKGNPETGKTALRHWGEGGALLHRYNDAIKEAQLTRACMHSAATGRLYPRFKAPGTFTCRLAGGSDGDSEIKFNIQQIPKKKEYLSCWIPDEGMVWVDRDFHALEPVVLTALSRDKAMMSLYGPNAKKNDIYLWVGAQLPGLGTKIRAAGYDPLNPTSEAIAHTKSVCKKERAICKTIVLGSQYGMGPRKLKLTLDLEGIQISEEEAYKLYEGYWKIFEGVKRYGYRLKDEWKKNRGWVLNGIGRPVCCAEYLDKDLTNRVVQSTGHDILMLSIEILLELRETCGFWFQGVIWDFHDQSIVQVRKENAKDMVELFREADRRLNLKLRELNPQFNLVVGGEPAIVSNLAEAKISE